MHKSYWAVASEDRECELLLPVKQTLCVYTGSRNKDTLIGFLIFRQISVKPISKRFLRVFLNDSAKDINVPKCTKNYFTNRPVPFLIN